MQLFSQSVSAEEPQSLKNLRVLLVAEAANPEWCSVALVGWSQARAIASYTNAHVVTQLHNREAFLRAGLIEAKDFTAIDSSAILKPIECIASMLRGGNNKGWTTVMALSALPYYYFEHLIWQKFGEDIINKKFDIVHRITPLSPTIPSLLAKKCHKAGVPFIIGPLNGGLPWPKAFDNVRRQEKEWLSYIRWVYRLLPGYRSTRDCATAIIVGSRATWQQIPQRYHHKCVYIPENAIDPQRFNKQRTRDVSSPLKVIFIGRLVPYKGADMLLEAAAPLIRESELTVDIVGDGPLMSQLKEIIKLRGIADGVNLIGLVQQDRVQDFLVEADVFAFPSIREFGGAVVLEAMAMGLVPIVVDYGGPGELVSPDSGYKVPMGNREDIIAGFRDILTRIVEDKQAIAQMRANATKRALSQFTWDAKARQTIEVYQWALRKEEGRRKKEEVFNISD